MGREVDVWWLGRRAYGPVLDLQLAMRERRRRGQGRDTVLLVEHEPVITMGSSAALAHVLADEAQRERAGIELFKVGRGGDVTYHGPGQLVGYPILDLKPDRCDVRRYVRSLAEAMILAVRDHGVEAGVVDGMIGVWADEASPDRWAGEPWAERITKLGAIGVRISRWVTMHGFALNLRPQLEHFATIVPCGISHHPVASVASLVGTAPSPRELVVGHDLAWLSRGLEVSVRRFVSAETEAAFVDLVDAATEGDARGKHSSSSR
ncbi:MAG: lipoyl(octanoyl) transferase LipB [Myxococcota bacterium]